MQKFGKGGCQGKGGGGGFAGGGMWQCNQCGFSNKPQNEVCGGNGPMGCKAPAPQGGGGFSGDFGNQMGQALMMGCGMAMGKGGMFGGGAMMKGDSKGKGKGKWVCELCKFTNGDRNEICGGKGPMGCNAPKPSDWVCSCGFKNKPANDVCGGKGPMGCKEPKPLK